MKIGLLIFFLGLIFSQDITSFDAKRAMDLLEIQCAFGPRYPGSLGHQHMKKFLILIKDIILHLQIILPDLINSQIIES